MAGDDAGSSKVLSDSAKKLEDQLRESVMAKLEDILAKQETDLMRRGQEAVAQLQKDRKMVMSSLTELQTRQSELMAQQAEMNRALLDISSKLEMVQDMSKALCGVAVPTAPLNEQEPPVVREEPEAMEAEEALLNGFDDILVDSSEGPALPPLLMSSMMPALGPDVVEMAACAAVQAVAMMEHEQFGGVGDFAEGPRTPPRQKSPAVLSLASALTPQQSTPPRSERHGPPRLSLAAHLDNMKEASPPLKLRADAPAFVPGEAC